jgi:hypothetical protein
MLIKRIGFYLVGVTLGVVGVSFFWKKKDVSFDYGMDARTLKTIRKKQRLFSNEAKQTMLQKNIDTLAISAVLENGDVDFSKSLPREKPCATYYVEGKYESKKIDLIVKRCDSTATIEKIIF